jgi:uncharacterized membrane protein HdeD (DUF308 family)
MNQSSTTHAASEPSAIGLSQMVLGIGVILVASLAASFAAVVLGIILIVRGGLDMYNGYRQDRAAPNRRRATMAVGALSLALGIVLTAFPRIGASIFSLALAALFLIAGVQKLLTPWTERKPAERVTVTSGAVSAALGVLIIGLWPIEDIGVVGVFGGIEILLNGMSMSLARQAAGRDMRTSAARAGF